MNILIFVIDIQYFIDDTSKFQTKNFPPPGILFSNENITKKVVNSNEISRSGETSQPPPGLELNTKSYSQNDEILNLYNDSMRIGENKESDVVEVNRDFDRPDFSLKSKGLRESSMEIHKKTINNEIYSSAKNFEDLGLSEELLQGIYSIMNFERPSSIQAATLPMILLPPYHHLVAQAHNGSGKTTCFVLAMISRVEISANEPQALCICPTRELVLQNLNVVQKMATFTKITFTSTATMEYELNLKQIKKHVIIGTHGKLKMWMNQRIISYRKLKVLRILSILNKKCIRC